MINTITHAIDTHGVNKLHYAIIDFTGTPITRLRFSDLHTNPTTLKRFINAISKRRGQSNLLKALEEAEKLFANKNEIRQEARQILIVFLDKKGVGNEEDVENVVKRLAEKRVKVLVIAIGMEVNPTDLQGITPMRNIINVPKEEEYSAVWNAILTLLQSGTVWCC